MSPLPSVDPNSAAPPALPSSAVFWRLLKLLRPYYAWIAVAIVLLVISSPCELFPALAWGYIADDVVLHQTAWPKIHYWFSLGGRVQGQYALLLSSIIWLLIVYLVGEVTGTLDTYILNRVAQHFILGFRNQVYRKLQSQGLAYLQGQRTGDLMSRAMGDVDEIQSFIVQAIEVIVGEGMLWLGAVGVVIWINWPVAIASLAPLVVVFFLLRIFNKRIRPLYSGVRERLGDVSTRLQENLSGVVVIKIFGREEQEAARFRDATQAHYDAQVKALNARSLFFPITRVIGFFSNIFMIGLGGYLMLKGRFTVGDLVVFRAYWWRLLGPIQTMARVNDMIQRAAAAARRVFDVLDTPDALADAPNAQTLGKVRGQLRLENVDFGYETVDGAPTAPIRAPT